MQADKWGSDPCIISFRIEGGDTTYVESISIDEANPDLKTTLYMAPIISSDVNSHPTEITAWFLSYTDSVNPVERELTIGPIDVVVEEDCPVTEFVNNPAVSTTTNYDYVIM